MTTRGRDDRALALAVTALAAPSLFALVRIARIIPLHVSLDSNEGWNAYQAVAAFTRDLYPHPPRFFFNNYPPLSFYVVGALGRFIGDPIVAGRLIAITAFLALAVMAGLAARHMRCTRIEAAFASALFVATTLALSHYVGIDDPQFLGQAVATAGVLWVIPESRSWRRLWLAAAFMSAGIFIKHNLVALPLAAVAWLWLRDRAAGRRLIHVAFCMWYAGLASLLGVLFLGGDGVDWNVMFESNFAWCLTAALALNRLPARSRIAWAVAFALLPAVAATLAIGRARLDPEPSLGVHSGHVPGFEEEVAFIARAQGPVLCEDLALCFWAGRSVDVDLVNLRQEVKHGSRAGDDLARLLDRHAYASIQLSAVDALPGKPLREALARSYVLLQQSPAGLLFVPRP
ncbi:MAG: hypothetical protein HY047_04850 [Acidobacteria bacterium]|nr:hypothetical protein [Acidobacteriota bacterium]